MPGLTNAESATTLDARFPTTGATDHIAYSANGTTRRRPWPVPRSVRPAGLLRRWLTRP